MILSEGGWLKIGQTTCCDDNTKIKDAALNRIRQETRTGIPEVCQIFDVFEYPESYGKIDDVIRNILTDDVYNLECSKKHNSEIDRYNHIKAGVEFVYGVTRRQVLNAVARYEHDLVLKYYGTEEFETLIQCIRNNAEYAVPYEIESDNSIVENNENNHWIDSLWDQVKKRLSKKVNTNISIYKGRPYMLTASEAFKGIIIYAAVYSVRYGLASVAVETCGGDEAKSIIEEKIATAPEGHQLKSVKVEQGAKRKDKWIWKICTDSDKSTEELVNWYVNTILILYQFFETED